MGPVSAPQPRKPRTAPTPGQCYPFKEAHPDRIWDDEEAWAAVQEVIGGASNGQRRRHFLRIKHELERWAESEGHAYCFARMDIMLALYPQSRGKTMRELEGRHGPTITRYERLFTAAGIACIVGERKSTGKRDYTRTYCELLADGETPFENVTVIGTPREGAPPDSWVRRAQAAGGGTPILNQPSGDSPGAVQQQLVGASEPPLQDPSPAVVQQLFQAPLRPSDEAAGFSRFSSVLSNPCRDTNALRPTAQSVVGTTDVEDVRAGARESSTQQIDDVADRSSAEPGPAESKGWGGGQVPDFARRRLDALVAEAQADPSQAVALSFVAFQLIFERRPLALSRGFAHRLRRALACCDRWRSAVGARAGAGFEELVALMVAHRLRLEAPPSQAQLRGFRHRRQWPRSPAYFVVPLRKRARHWRREHDPERRSRSESFRRQRPASYQGGVPGAQERRKRKGGR